MSKQDIFNTLKHYGPTFYGSDDSQAMEIAAEWAEDFTSGEADKWMAAGFWCPSTAARVRDIGLSVDRVRAICEDIKDENHPDPAYSMCNGDLNIDVLE